MTAKGKLMYNSSDINYLVPNLRILKVSEFDDDSLADTIESRWREILRLMRIHTAKLISPAKGDKVAPPVARRLNQ
jgi:hypothetical protein